MLRVADRCQKTGVSPDAPAILGGTGTFAGEAERVALPLVPRQDLFNEQLVFRCSLANTLRFQRLEFGREKLTKGPDMIRQACRHRWRALPPSGTNRPMVCALLRRQRL